MISSVQNTAPVDPHRFEQAQAPAHPVKPKKAEPQDSVELSPQAKAVSEHHRRKH